MRRRSQIKDQGGAATAPDRRVGSPRDHLCADPGPTPTAPGEAIEFVDPVPLDLVQTVLTREMRRLRGAISEMHVQRTRGHVYLIMLVVRTGVGA
ncbi:hypothetical protein J2129_000573 [Methanofollis sp. W23]|uniref:hypothetical protein n=1 Tax=Methanofollis sp. W23 TaxID=2817849 RepID=UPI001AEB6547|nr:hypothetical protein [Methanofollis sp. W23]MBP2145119.1 hypothetical protein [Methanofollis sp. W23]